MMTTQNTKPNAPTPLQRFLSTRSREETYLQPEMCSIYGLRDKNSKTYFYVGSTKFTPEERWRGHKDSIRRGAHVNRYLANKVRRIGIDNIVVDLIDSVIPEKRYEEEYWWIQTFIDMGIKLTNSLTKLEDQKAWCANREFESNWEDPEYPLKKLGYWWYVLRSVMDDSHPDWMASSTRRLLDEMRAIVLYGVLHLMIDCRVEFAQMLGLKSSDILPDFGFEKAPSFLQVKEALLPDKNWRESRG